ncbi:NTP pyrophosphohydrolase [Sphaerochaeta pleomorpha str. Grapes]|uniref:GDP-mannose pyrophosphatase n=1 Tax=Sphaerochaeta pleomorpha (strain ATCC BAA-1885 / DSM 22778 / Grapes) TaxID=158190 RepID=G8QRG0_SPHPG|nr:NUDIX hydrolase [Sphaerochaeta pleomorpha]AEV28813.1 NTP pyrophosphohydrolase [Sphaerochaeta pleomorpha str. Grapes]
MNAKKERIYQDTSYTIDAVKLELDNGMLCEFPLINHPGGVVILAMNEYRQIALVKQNRFAIGEETLELPAGKLDNKPNETPLDGAKRELREEVGVLANDWTFLGHVYPSPGILNEKLWLYFAKDIVLSKQDLDFDEILTAEWMSLSSFRSLLLTGKITDAKTLCAYALAKEKNFL